MKCIEKQVADLRRGDLRTETSRNNFENKCVDECNRHVNVVTDLDLIIESDDEDADEDDNQPVMEAYPAARDFKARHWMLI